MKTALLHEDGGLRTFAVVLGNADEAIAALTSFATEHRLGAAQFTAIGAFSLVEGFVRPTLEIVLTETPRHLHRRFDPGSGLNLIDPR
jgi:predicted DNA-binding protein with PD1-like motif